MALANLLGALALDSTLDAVRSAVTAVKASLDKSISPYGGQMVTTAQRRFRSEFNTLSDNWIKTKVSGTGPMDAAVSNGTLVFTSGITAGDEVSVTGNPLTRTLGVPSRTAFCLNFSSKQVNSEFYIELVALNADGSLDETIVSEWRFVGGESTAGNVARYACRNGARPGRSSGNVSIPSNIGSDVVLEIRLETDEVWFSARNPDTSASKNSSYVSNRVAVDPNRTYVPRMRMVNGITNVSTGVVNRTTGPGAGYTVTVSYVTGNDYTDLIAEISGSDGDYTAARSIPVQLANSPTVSANLLAGSQVVGASGQVVLSFVESNAALTAGNSVAGTGRDCLGPVGSRQGGYNGTEFRASVFSDQPGNLFLQVSTDATTWRTVKVVPTAEVVAGGLQYAEYRHFPSVRYARATFTSTGSATTTIFGLFTNQLG